MRLTLSGIQAAVKAFGRKVSVALVLIGVCAIGAGTILTYNAPRPCHLLNATLELGSAEIVFGLFAIWLVCPSVFRLPLRLVRTKKRVMILATTVVAVSTSWKTWERASRFRETAQLHADSEQQYLEALNAIKRGELTKGCVLQDDGSLALMSAEGLVPIYQRSAGYHTAMRRKYERAYRYPWLPVVTDPPQPK